MTSSANGIATTRDALKMLGDFMVDPPPNLRKSQKPIKMRVQTKTMRCLRFMGKKASIHNITTIPNIVKWTYCLKILSLRL